MAETKISKEQAASGIWTSDSLLAGTNISITQVPQPVIDENTVGLCHFDDDVQDIITGDNWPSQYLSYVSGKFGKARTAKFQSGFCDITPYYSFDSNLTLDFWISPSASSRTIRLTDQMQSTSSSSTFIIIPDISANNAQITLGPSFSGTGTGTNVNLKDSSVVWGSSFVHIAYEVDITNSKVFLFVNGKKIIENTKTSSIGTKNISTHTSASGTLYGSFIDEFRVSNIVRWTADFTPFTQPYAASAGPTQYAINNTKADPDLSSYLQNTSTGDGALTIIGTSTSGQYATNIGGSSSSTGQGATAIGSGTVANGQYACAVGFQASAVTGSVCIGGGVGNSYPYASSNYSIAIGCNARIPSSSNYAISIGNGSKATAQSAIQLGAGTNSTASTFQVFNTTVVNASGKVPMASTDITSLAGYDATKTQVLKNVNGTLTWVDEA